MGWECLPFRKDSSVALMSACRYLRSGFKLKKSEAVCDHLGEISRKRFLNSSQNRCSVYNSHRFPVVKLYRGRNLRRRWMHMSMSTSLSDTHTPTFSHTLSLSHTHTHSLSLFHAHTLSLTHTLSLSHSLSLTHTLSHTQTLTRTLYLPLVDTHTRSLRPAAALDAHVDVGRDPRQLLVDRHLCKITGYES